MSTSPDPTSAPDPGGASRPDEQPPTEHPAGHEDEVLLDSPEQAAALLGAGDPGGAGDPDGAPWADDPDHLGEDELPQPSAAVPGDEGAPGEAPDDEGLPTSVEGVGDLVADPLSRAKVVPRDDPGPAPEDEVPPSPS